jgi:hypothetical protein
MIGQSDKIQSGFFTGLQDKGGCVGTVAVDGMDV